MQVGYAEIAILSLYLALVPVVSAATSQVLSTESPVEHGQRIPLVVTHRSKAPFIATQLDVKSS